jgi:ferritin-like metal-binding protein YciE
MLEKWRRARMSAVPAYEPEPVMAKKTLRDLLIEELRDLYHADKQLMKAFPRLAKRAAGEEVRKLCEEGVDYTEERLRRLEESFAALDTPARGKTCHAMAGLIEEAMETLRGDFSDGVRDAALLANIQRISHYGIAGYGTVCAYAKVIGADDIAGLLAKSLGEKKEADEEMSELAEREINRRALQGAEGDGESEGRVDKAAAGDKPATHRRRKSKA